MRCAARVCVEREGEGESVGGFFIIILFKKKKKKIRRASSLGCQRTMRHIFSF
jgi:hypothetical protein